MLQPCPAPPSSLGMMQRAHKGALWGILRAELLLFILIGWVTHAYAAQPVCVGKYDVAKSGIVDTLKGIYGDEYSKFELRYPQLDDTVQISIVGNSTPKLAFPLMTPSGYKWIDKAEYNWFFFKSKKQGDPAIDVAFEQCSGHAVGVLDPTLAIGGLPHR